ncbi:MAG: hypothetical protein KDL87_01565 [Verrucomicrobiae bacterium]|nr:hypothetical protein [Verrucomicrobiae bacterium]
MTPERRIILGLVLLLAALEVAVRQVEPRLSKDLAHVHSLSELPEKLAPGTGGVLVMGNSLARCGIAPARLSAGLTGQPEVALMVPDATAAIEWAWGYRRHVLHAGARPALVILVTGRTHLFDPAHKQIERLGAFHVGGGGDQWRFLTNELGGVEERASFLISSVSRLYADRGRIQPLVFYNFIPSYESSVNRINMAAGGGFSQEMEPNLEESRGLANCQRLVDSVRESGARLVVVTAPLPEPWSLPEAVSQLLKKNEVPVIPLGSEVRLSAERFPDGYHLDPAGAEIATAALVKALGELGTQAKPPN